MNRCCPRYHQAVELIGKRWSGAILAVLLDADGPLRFTELAQSVPQLSDRLLSERLKELEAHGLVVRCECGDHPVRVEYALTEKGADLAPAVAELKAWAERWMSGRTPAGSA